MKFCLMSLFIELMFLIELRLFIYNNVKLLRFEPAPEICQTISQNYKLYFIVPTTRKIIYKQIILPLDVARIFGLPGAPLYESSVGGCICGSVADSPVKFFFVAVSGGGSV
ncbi:MAG: hypothetical protein K2L55_06150, partial [Muribaculaceae bacterium]|nr:hypothetical protein [Muribaculaceae bacterium]